MTMKDRLKGQESEKRERGGQSHRYLDPFRTGEKGEKVKKKKKKERKGKKIYIDSTYRP